MQKRLEATTITVPVPLHEPLRRGTLGSIVRQSGLAFRVSEVCLKTGCTYSGSDHTPRPARLTELLGRYPPKIANVCLGKKAAISAPTGGAHPERRPHRMTFRMDPV